MNNDKLKMIRREMMIQGKKWFNVNIIKPAAFFYSNRYHIDNEGGEDGFNRKYISIKAKRAIDCYGLTNAGLLMEAMVVDKKYGYSEPWEIIAYTDYIEMCPLNPIGRLKDTSCGRRNRKSRYL